MANQILLGRALDANGYIAPGAKATIYADGTSTLITVYSDVAGTVVAANPIVADGDGFWPQRYVAEDAKAVVTDADDVALYTLDPAPTAQGTGAAASAISFSPTVDIPQTTVQAAIEAAAALAVSGFAAFGLGITGNATLLANIDATGTGAGLYRFDGTTTGTYPTGVAAGDTGLIELWRQAGATAMMELHHATSNRVFRRRMTTSTWGAWREIPVVDQATVQGDIIYRGSADFQRLAKGTAGQLLRMNSGATAPEWAAGTDRVLLATKTASASATLDFTEFNNAVYRRYEFELANVKPATDNVDFYLRTSTDAGSSYDAGASDYAWGSAGTSAASATTGASAGDTAMLMTTVVKIGNAAAEYGVSGLLNVTGAPSASVFTEMRGQWTYWNTSGAMVHLSGGGARLSAEDTDAIRFLFSSGNITSGTIRMYGVI